MPPRPSAHLYCQRSRNLLYYAAWRYHWGRPPYRIFCFSTPSGVCFALAPVFEGDSGEICPANPPPGTGALSAIMRDSPQEYGVSAERASGMKWHQAIVGFLGLKKNMLVLLSMVILVGMGERMAERFLRAWRPSPLATACACPTIWRTWSGSSTSRCAVRLVSPASRKRGVVAKGKA